MWCLQMNWIPIDRGVDQGYQGRHAACLLTLVEGQASVALRGCRQATKWDAHPPQDEEDEDEEMTVDRMVVECEAQNLGFHLEGKVRYKRIWRHC